MFKKTRNRILMLNMIMVSAVVIAAFAVIFVTTYTREQASNKVKLFNDPMPQVSVAGGPFASGNLYAQPVTIGSGIISGFDRRIMPNAGLSFSILVDNDGNLLGINSMLNLPDEAYSKAAVEAKRSDGRSSTVAFEGRTWQYAVFPVAIEFREFGNVSFVVSGAYNDVRFLDVTDSHRMLLNLGLTLAGLTAAILTVIFFISRVFANRAIRPMEDAFDKQSRFVADASHELKTPLSIISANCGVMYANSEETVDSQTKWVDSTMRAVDRMNGLVGDMLSLSRIEEKETELRIVYFDLSADAANIVSEMDSAAIEKGISIQNRIEPEMHIESDRDQILKVLSILLDNAIKYTGSGGEISVAVKRENRRVLCSVRNSGEGIPKDDLRRVFDRFYRGDPSRSAEVGGYGLGLAIAKAISDRLGAKLLAASEPGEYTEFKLVIG